MSVRWKDTILFVVALAVLVVITFVTENPLVMLIWAGLIFGLPGLQAATSVFRIKTGAIAEEVKKEESKDGDAAKPAK